VNAASTRSIRMRSIIRSIGTGRNGLLGLQGSIDKGKTWNNLKPPRMSAIFYPPVQVYGATVAIGANSLIVSRNKGRKWASVPLGLPTGDKSTAISMTDDSTLFVATGCRFSSPGQMGSDGLADYSAGLADNRHISSIVADGGVTPRLWVTISQAQPGSPSIYRSDNGGASWVGCTVGLPAIPMNAIAIDPTDSDRVWAAADVGVYQTLDGGNTWNSFSAGTAERHGGRSSFPREGPKAHLWNQKSGRLADSKCHKAMECNHTGQGDCHGFHRASFRAFTGQR